VTDPKQEGVKTFTDRRKPLLRWRANRPFGYVP